jgi:hypothetical protein
MKFVRLRSSRGLAERLHDPEHERQQVQQDEHVDEVAETVAQELGEQNHDDGRGEEAQDLKRQISRRNSGCQEQHQGNRLLSAEEISIGQSSRSIRLCLRPLSLAQTIPREATIRRTSVE